ncbi:hypothetical protein CRE_11858 [Caenorhabditis remanei]|uniref:Uncharacterized protein n=1 Tax=Caenorhabditis remanei TaxID=31234 RepID=E3M445_CAERE|nr:hypothetical protein CRE_11858 [Caenorhabditis remanei]
MKQFTAVSLFIIFISRINASSSCQNSSFELILIEDKRAFHTRQFHIFYDKEFKSVAQMVKCQVTGTVKAVSMEEIKSDTLKKICELNAYSSKLEDKLKKKNYMTTITNQYRYSESDVSCDALNQFNLMRTSEKKWAVLIRGYASEILLPIESVNGFLSKDSLSFAINSLFFATAYGFGDSTFKSLGGETGVKGVSDFSSFVCNIVLFQKLLLITVIVYVMAVLVAVVALVFLVALYFMKRNANIKKRESEKSKLLRNPANNNDNDTPVEIIYDTSSDNKL